MAKGYWVSVYPAISDPEGLTAYDELAGVAVQAGGGRVLSRIPSRGGRVVAHEAGITQRVVLIVDAFTALSIGNMSSSGTAVTTRPGNRPTGKWCVGGSRNLRCS